jgi:WXG100 family type VII secretion target
MANVHVDYEQVQRSAAQLQSGQEEMLTQLTRLKSVIDSLIGSGFATDQASGKFQQSYNQWNSGAKNVMEGLAGMSGFLKQAIAQHQQLDSTLSQQVGG